MIQRRDCLFVCLRRNLGEIKGLNNEEKILVKKVGEIYFPYLQTIFSVSEDVSLFSGHTSCLICQAASYQLTLTHYKPFIFMSKAKAKRILVLQNHISNCFIHIITATTTGVVAEKMISATTDRLREKLSSIFSDDLCWRR